MIQTIYGKKVGMTQIFDENDRLTPITVLSVDPNVVAQVKTTAKDEKSGKTDGYNAVQLGFGKVRKDNKGKARVNKPTAGHFKKLGIEPTKYLREVRLTDEEIAEVKANTPDNSIFSGEFNEWCMTTARELANNLTEVQLLQWVQTNKPYDTRGIKKA